MRKNESRRLSSQAPADYPPKTDEEGDGLCPECIKIFEMVLAENEKLNKNPEFSSLLKQLKQACDED